QEGAGTAGGRGPSARDSRRAEEIAQDQLPEGEAMREGMLVRLRILALAAALAFVGAARADINVGVTLSATGPAASLGIPEKNTFELIGSPTIGGQKINFVVLDDKSDTTEAVKNTRKLISEDKVDVIVGTTVTPN